MDPFSNRSHDRSSLCSALHLWSFAACFPPKVSKFQFPIIILPTLCSTLHSSYYFLTFELIFEANMAKILKNGHKFDYLYVGNWLWKRLDTVQLLQFVLLHAIWKGCLVQDNVYITLEMDALFHSFWLLLGFSCRKHRDCNVTAESVYRHQISHYLQKGILYIMLIPFCCLKLNFKPQPFVIRDEVVFLH